MQADLYNGRKTVVVVSCLLKADRSNDLLDICHCFCHSE